MSTNTSEEKSLKAVAWRYRDRHEAEADVWNYLDLPPLMTYDYVEPLVLQSTLHATEAAYARMDEAYLAQWEESVRLEAELGEFRRRVKNLVSDLVALAKEHGLQADKPYQDSGTVGWHSGYDEGVTESADRLRQLLASDGGADGDNEGEGK